MREDKQQEKHGGPEIEKIINESLCFLFESDSFADASFSPSLLSDAFFFSCRGSYLARMLCYFA